MANKFGKKSTAEEVTMGINFKDKNVLITGANTGIGKESARVMAKRGANVYMVIRSKDKGEQAKKDIINDLNNDTEYKEFSEKENIEDIDSRLKLIICDLSSLQSIYDCCKNLKELNIKLEYVLLNAGLLGNLGMKTKDDFELNFGVNHLGHFYFIKLLTPMLLENEKTRIVVVSSMAESGSPKKLDTLLDDWIKNNEAPGKEKWGRVTFYSLSKAFNVLFARGLEYKFSKNGFEAASNHPGIISTDIGRNSKKARFLFKIAKPMSKTIPQGAATQLRCLTMNSNDIKNGGYYYDCVFADKKLSKQMKPNEIKNDDEFNQSMEGKLWELSENLIKNKGFSLDL